MDSNKAWRWGQAVGKVIRIPIMGAIAYSGLWLCGVPTRPLGYLGAALVAVAVWNLAIITAVSIRE